MFLNRVSSCGRRGAVAGAIVLLASCGGGGGGGGGTGFVPFVPSVPPAQTPEPPVVVKHTVGGTVSGLAGSVVLQNNAGDDLKLTADGKFTFATAIAEGSAYEVSVRTQPLWQFCTVTKGSGKVSADVADVAVACSAAQAQVSVFAGSGAAGSAVGAGTAASFSLPYGIVFDKDRNLFVSDVQTGLLRKITPAGETTTIAGGGSFNGPVDGNGPAAYFDGLGGIALDADGNIYATELSGNRIRKITPSADVTTFAGDGARRTLDGNGTSASFAGPAGLVRDAAGNIYVSEYYSHVIRKISPARDVTTIAGTPNLPGFADGTGTAALFSGLYSMAMDKDGNLYAADSRNNRIRKITPGGVVTTLAGSGTSGSADGPAGTASFNAPGGVALDSDGNVYVADTGNNLLRRITRAGVVSTLAGQAGMTGAQNGIGSAARFKQPYGVVVDADGTLYIADTFNNLIRKVTPVPAS